MAVHDLQIFYSGSCYSIFSLMCNVLSLFVLLSFLFWPLCCLSFFDLRILIFLWYLQTLLCFCVCYVVMICITQNLLYVYVLVLCVYLTTLSLVSMKDVG